jgi:probable HAF family extracellular repeat protein
VYTYRNHLTPRLPRFICSFQKIIRKLRLGGDCFSRAIAINSHAQVVGNSFSCDGNFDHAFIWENGSLIDLNTLIPADSSLQLAGGSDVNDRGEIAGIGVPSGVSPANVFTEGHAFLLIPCDENHPGIEGCDYGAVEAVEVTNNGVAPRPPAIPPTMDSLVRTNSPLQNWFNHRYRVLGQRPALRH